MERCIVVNGKVIGPPAGDAQNNRKIVGFSFAGLGALLIDVVMFNLLYLGGLSSSISSFTSLTVALAFNFAINLFVFSDQPLLRKSGGAFARFAIVALASGSYVYLAFEAFIFLFPDTEGISMTFVRVVLFGTATIGRFFLYKRWVF